MVLNRIWIEKKCEQINLNLTLLSFENIFSSRGDCGLTKICQFMPLMVYLLIFFLIETDNELIRPYIQCDAIFCGLEFIQSLFIDNWARWSAHKVYNISISV